MPPKVLLKEAGAIFGGAKDVINGPKMKENTPSPDTLKQRNGTVGFEREKDEFVDELEKGAGGDRKPEDVVQVPAA